MRAPHLVLTCDGGGCRAIPTKAPRLYCPAKVTGAANHLYDPVTLAFPGLNYCEPCWNTKMRLSLLLTDKVKARIEAKGKQIWPQWVKPDFDAALIEPIDVFSPEYGAYMERLGYRIDGMGYSLHRRLRRRPSLQTAWL